MDLVARSTSLTTPHFYIRLLNLEPKGYDATQRHWSKSRASKHRFPQSWCLELSPRRGRRFKRAPLWQKNKLFPILMMKKSKIDDLSFKFASIEIFSDQDLGFRNWTQLIKSEQIYKKKVWSRVTKFIQIKKSQAPNWALDAKVWCWGEVLALARPRQGKDVS